jgi:hypothetical protein
MSPVKRKKARALSGNWTRLRRPIPSEKNLFKPTLQMDYRHNSMVRSSRSAVKTLSINRSRDIVVERLTRQCEEGDHSKCTGWAVLKKEHSPINANYFLKCTCSCHKKGAQVKRKPLRAKKVAHKTKKRTTKRKIKSKSKKRRR